MSSLLENMAANKKWKQLFISQSPLARLISEYFWFLISEGDSIWVLVQLCTALGRPLTSKLAFWYFDPLSFLPSSSSSWTRWWREAHLIADDLGHPGPLPLHRRDPLLQAREHHLRVHLISNHLDDDDDCDDDHQFIMVMMMIMTMQMMLQLPPLGPLYLLLNITKAGRIKTNVGCWQNEAASYKTNQTNQAKQIKLMLFVDKMGPLVNSPEMPQPVDRRLKPIDTSIGVELSWWWWWWWWQENIACPSSASSSSQGSAPVSMSGHCGYHSINMRLK